tara:strand:+ start:1475 stop:2635 length:1161 start_codon:yes stop_codon:yes gene_type:complete
MTLDELLLEWSYRSERGYPSTDNPSDVLLLKEILRELKLPEAEIDGLVDDLEGDKDIKVNSDQGGKEEIPIDPPTPKLEPEEPKKDTSATDKLYDAVIRAHLNLDENEPIPRVKGIYKWPGQGGATFNIQVESEDMKYWNDFWTLTPPKAGAAIGTTSKGSGDGEISLYWLYQHSDSGVQARGTQGSDNPDLEFNGVGVEVKAYGKIAHESAKGLGRFSSDKPQLDALGILFGFQKLIVALEPKASGKFPADISPSNFHAHQLIGAFEVLQQLLEVDLDALGEEYSLFKDIKTRLDSLKSKIGEWDNPEDGARKMTVYFMSPKVGRKPGDGGFLVNVKDDGDCRFWGFSTEKLVNHPDLIKRLPQGGGLVGASNSQMYVSFDKLLG